MKGAPENRGVARVVAVEDNEDDEMLLRLAIGRTGIRHALVVARDGAEALDVLFGAASGLPPTLVLLDLRLPRVSGMEVLRRIRADGRTRFVPVVVLTTSNEEVDLIESYTLGANGYVTKPVDFDRFVDVVKRVGEFWLALNELPPMTATPGGRT